MLYKIEVTETMTAKTTYIVDAPDEETARTKAESGECVSAETPEDPTITSRVVDTIAKYDGPRYVIEQEPGDPEYWNVLDLVNEEVVAFSLMHEDAMIEAKARNEGV